MRLTLITFVFTMSFAVSVYGQSRSNMDVEINNLNALIDEIDSQIGKLKQKRTALENRIAEINRTIEGSELKQRNLEGIPTVVSLSGGILRDRPSASGIEVDRVPGGDTILVFDAYEAPYFMASYKGAKGYISYGSLNSNTQINKILNNELAKENPKLSRLAKKHGLSKAKRLIKKEYWIGMSQEEARDSVGHPDDINKSIGSWGVHEQWVYNKEDLYLYFEDGKLTSIQD